MKIFCKDINEIPNKKVLESFIKNESLKIEFPKFSFEQYEEKIIDLLSLQLTDCSVFVGGRTDSSITITVFPVISKVLINANIDLTIKAIKDYIRLSDLLIENVTDDEDWNEWTINYEHFPHVEYINIKTKQSVDTCAYKMSRFSEIDPDFLGKFICTSSEYQSLKKLIKHQYHDSTRILKIVEQTGIIQAYLEDR